MEYDRILNDALRLVWRNKFLWIFALLGGGSASSCGGAPGLNLQSAFSGLSSGSTPSPSRSAPTPSGDSIASAAAMQQFLVSHMASIVGIGLMVAAVILIFFVLSFVARGALIWSVGRVSRGEAAGLRIGWGKGEEYGFRYFRLWLIELAIGFLLLVLVGIVIGMLLVFAQLGEAAKVMAIIAGVLMGIASFLAAIIGGIAFSVVVEFAERAIAIDELGARASLQRGFDLLMANFWPSALVWIISVAVAIGAGIVMAFPMLIVGVPIGVAVFGVYAAAGLTAPTVAAAVLAALIFITVVWVVAAASSAFLSTYWTLAYLSMTKRYPPAAPQPEPVPSFT